MWDLVPRVTDWGISLQMKSFQLWRLCSTDVGRRTGSLSIRGGSGGERMIARGPLFGVKTTVKVEEGGSQSVGGSRRPSILEESHTQVCHTKCLNSVKMF